MVDVSRTLELRMQIAGDWVESRSGETFETVSPASGEVLAVLPRAGREDALAAVEAAGRARARMPTCRRSSAGTSVTLSEVCSTGAETSSGASSPSSRASRIGRRRTRLPSQQRLP